MNEHASVAPVVQLFDASFSAHPLVRVRADLRRFGAGEVALHIEGGVIETSVHRFDTLWWQPVLTATRLPVDEYYRPLFGDEIPSVEARAIWSAMMAAARPFLDLRAMRLALLAGDVQRLYEVLAFRPALQRFVYAYRAAGPLLAFHRSFKFQESEQPDHAFARLVREAGPVVQSYIPIVFPFEGREADLLDPRFLAWARRVRFRPRFRPFNMATVAQAAQLVFAAADAATGWATDVESPALLGRHARILLDEALLRRSGLDRDIVADTAAWVQRVEARPEVQTHGFAMVAAQVLGEKESGR